MKASTAQRPPKPARPVSAADRIRPLPYKPDSFTVAEIREAVRKVFEERKKRQAAGGA